MNRSEIVNEIKQYVGSNKDPNRRPYNQWHIGISNNNNIEKWKKRHSKEKNIDNWRDWPAGKTKAVAYAVKLHFMLNGMHSGGDEHHAPEDIRVYVF